MKAQDTVNKLAEHLLGRDFYIADPVNGEQANEIIAKEICSRYSAVDEQPIDKYRRKHKKCKWCVYGKRIIPILPEVPPYYECIVKDKIVNSNISRLFCTTFQLKRKEN